MKGIEQDGQSCVQEELANPFIISTIEKYIGASKYTDGRIGYSQQILDDDISCQSLKHEDLFVDYKTTKTKILWKSSFI